MGCRPQLPTLPRHPNTCHRVSMHGLATHFRRRGRPPRKTRGRHHERDPRGAHAVALDHTVEELRYDSVGVGTRRWRGTPSAAGLRPRASCSAIDAVCSLNRLKMCTATPSCWRLGPLHSQEFQRDPVNFAFGIALCRREPAAQHRNAGLCHIRLGLSLADARGSRS